MFEDLLFKRDENKVVSYYGLQRSLAPILRNNLGLPLLAKFERIAEKYWGRRFEAIIERQNFCCYCD